MKPGIRAAMALATLALGIAPATGALQSAVNVSGYEYSLGEKCTVNGQAATCGVQFGGWTGGDGKVDDGWTGFPGNGRGLWKAKVNRVGGADFGGRVKIVGGSFDLLYTSGRRVLGKITGGSVAWPAKGQRSVCGKEVAVISVAIQYQIGASGTGAFVGCLHDLPVGRVVPPKIWGTLK